MTLVHFKAAAARRHGILFALLSTQLTVVACGGQQNGASSHDSKTGTVAHSLADAPQWVTGDCRDFFNGESVICGVGSVSGVASPSLARNTAMARGRTEIARYLSIEVKSVLTDYQAVNGETTTQEIEERSAQITDMTLNGSRMASYFLAKDGTYYALVALELAAFTDSVRTAQTIDEPLKNALIDHASKAFSSRDSETSRY